jgi:fatty-acyl-CoA synthase
MRPVGFIPSAILKKSVERRVSTVGRVQPHLEVKVVDASGETVPLNVTGELWTRGYSVMKGYWQDEARTRESIVDGWMRTGDLATIDDQGYCNIVGRLKDMVIRGGENIYPREIEEFLYGHPDVQEVQAFGVPDARYGEELCVWVVPRPGAELNEALIRAYCQGKIAHYKVPRYVRIKGQLPMIVTGKAQKFVMRDEMLKDLGLTTG